MFYKLTLITVLCCVGIACYADMGCYGSYTPENYRWSLGNGVIIEQISISKPPLWDAAEWERVAQTGYYKDVPFGIVPESYTDSWKNGNWLELDITFPPYKVSAKEKDQRQWIENSFKGPGYTTVEGIVIKYKWKKSIINGVGSGDTYRVHHVPAVFAAAIDYYVNKKAYDHNREVGGGYDAKAIGEQRYRDAEAAMQRMIQSKGEGSALGIYGNPGPLPPTISKNN